MVRIAAKVSISVSPLLIQSLGISWQSIAQIRELCWGGGKERVKYRILKLTCVIAIVCAGGSGDHVRLSATRKGRLRVLVELPDAKIKTRGLH